MSLSAPDLISVRLNNLTGPSGEAIKATLSVVPWRAVDETLDYGVHAKVHTFKDHIELQLPVGIGRWIFIRPDDNQLEPAWVRLPAIRRGSPAIELGSVHFRKSDELYVHVDLPDGTPAKQATIRMNFESAFECDNLGDWWPEGHTETDLMGRIIGPISVEDQRERTRLVPFRTKLTGKSPWHVAWPKGFVEIAFSVPQEVDLDGAPIDESSRVFLAGQAFDFDLIGKNPKIRLEGLAPGRHRMIVSQCGFYAHEIEFTLAEGGLTIPIQLRRRR